MWSNLYYQGGARREIETRIRNLNSEKAEEAKKIDDLKELNNQDC